MRCPDCNKFVGYDAEEEPEVEIEVDENGLVTGSVRIVNKCAECGTELKEATLELEVDLSEECKEHHGDGHELSVEATNVERTEDSRGPKPSTPARYRKTFYGATLEAVVTCSCAEDFSASEEWKDEVQASAMDEMV